MSIRHGFPKTVARHLAVWIVGSSFLMFVVNFDSGKLPSAGRLGRVVLEIFLMLAPSVYGGMWWMDRQRPNLATRLGIFVVGCLAWIALMVPLVRLAGVTAAWAGMAAATLLIASTVLGVRGAWRGRRARSELSVAEQLQVAAEQRLFGAQLAPFVLQELLQTLEFVATRDPAAASGLILDLASMMRHLVEGARSDFVASGEEWRFVDGYRRFAQARLGGDARVIMTFEGDGDEPMPSLLVVTLFVHALKNSARHGGSLDLQMALQVSENEFRLEVSTPRSGAVAPDDQRGMRLMRRRLAHLHPGRNRVESRVEGERQILEMSAW